MNDKKNLLNPLNLLTILKEEDIMKPNISDGERLIRVILGIYGMLLGFLFIQGVVGIILGVVGLVTFATGASGWCGLYTLLGKSTLTAPKQPAVEEVVSTD